MTDAKTVAAGTKAPVFTLPSQKNEKVSLKDYAGKWVVLYFYPKDDTPGCTTEACEFTNILSGFDDLNAVVLGVSPDTPESHQKFIEKHNLKLDLLSDPEKKVMGKYGAFGVKKMYGKEVQGVIRSTFLINPKGEVAHAWRSVKAAGHAEKVREKLRSLS